MKASLSYEDDLHRLAAQHIEAAGVELHRRQSA